jgi:hypothetical protein
MREAACGFSKHSSSKADFFPPLALIWQTCCPIDGVGNGRFKSTFMVLAITVHLRLCL